MTDARAVRSAVRVVPAAGLRLPGGDSPVHGPRCGLVSLMSDSYAEVATVLSQSFGVSEEFLRSEATLASLDLDALSVAELSGAMERAGVRLGGIAPSTSLDEVVHLLHDAFIDNDPAEAAVHEPE